MGEAEIPKTLSGLKIWTLLWSDMYVKTKSQVFSLSPSFTIWAQWILPWSSFNMPVTSGEKNIQWWKNLVIHYIKAVSISVYICISIFRKSANLIFLSVQFAEPKPDQLRQTPVTALPTQACPAGTRHDGRMTSSAPRYPDPAITGARYIWTCQTTWPFAPESSLYDPSNTQISGFLKTTQLFGPLNFISVITAFDSDFTKFLSDCDHDQLRFFSDHYLSRFQ